MYLWTCARHFLRILVHSRKQAVDMLFGVRHHVLLQGRLCRHGRRVLRVTCPPSLHFLWSEPSFLLENLLLGPLCSALASPVCFLVNLSPKTPSLSSARQTHVFLGTVTKSRSIAVGLTWCALSLYVYGCWGWCRNL